VVKLLPFEKEYVIPIKQFDRFSHRLKKDFVFSNAHNNK